MATANSKYNLAPIQSSYVNDGGQDVAGLLRQRYDVNKQKYDTIERSAKNLDVLGGDQHLKDSAIQGIHDGIANTARRGDYESSGGEIDELANSFATNQGLQAASDSYGIRQQELQTQANITAQGGQIIDFGNITDAEGNVIGHQSDNHQSYWTDEATGEIHTDVYQGGSEHRKNTAEQMKKLIGNIATDPMALKRLSGEFAGMLQYGNQVTKRKANRVAAGLYDAYLGTDAGSQQYRELTELDKMTEEEAQNQIVSELQALAREQVGSKKQYMTDPRGAGATSIGTRKAMTLTGNAIKSQGVDLFTEINQSIADINVQLREETDPAKRKLLGTELRHQNIKYQDARRKAALTSNDPLLKAAAQAEAHMFSGENNRFSILQSPLEALINGDYYVDSDMAANMWNPFGGGSSMGTFDVDPSTAASLGMDPDAEGNYQMPFHNVSNVLDPESTERDMLKMQFSDFDSLNKAFGTDYTADDIPKLQQLADDYYTYVNEQNGQDLIDYVNSSIEIKQDDRVAFGVDGTSELADVNNTLKQADALQDFMILDASGTPLSAKAMKTFKADYLDAVTNDKITFGGLVMPNMWSGTEASLFLNVNGENVRAIPMKTNGSAYGPPLLNQIAGHLGLGNLYDVQNQMVDRQEAGDMKNSEAEERYLHASGLSSERNTDGAITRLGLLDAPGFIAAMDGGTLSDWSIEMNLPPSAVMQSAITLKQMETSKLRSISMLSDIAWTEDEVRDLDNKKGTVANLAEFDRVLDLWERLPYNTNN